MTIAVAVGVVAPGGAVDKLGRVTEFSAGITPGASRQGITAGPDGNLWFISNFGTLIGRITPTGEITELSSGLPDFGGSSGPADLTAGPAGNLWFTDRAQTRIGRITPTGEVTEFSAGITPESGLDSITAGPDGNLWFTEADA
ncbi:MAG: hypothetical protein MUP67_00200, partial [Acidimicrobiia bacterium]|nr:hypothetical protein [Acidimicrobiia bacterium]